MSNAIVRGSHRYPNLRPEGYPCGRCPFVARSPGQLGGHRAWCPDPKHDPQHPLAGEIARLGTGEDAP